MQDASFPRLTRLNDSSPSRVAGFIRLCEHGSEVYIQWVSQQRQVYRACTDLLKPKSLPKGLYVKSYFIISFDGWLNLG